MKRSRSRGYTAVEVLSAMTLLAIGGAGVIGMQRVTIQGSEDARRFDLGTNIANEWLSRLQRDSTQWTMPTSSDPNTLNINTTRFLSVEACFFPNWCHPPAANPASGLSGSFDIFGRDLVAATGGATYCTQYRLQWIASPGIAAPYNTTALLRAEVRVYWARLERNPVGLCTDTAPDVNDANERYHFIVATTAIRENQLRQ
jgi:type II secretory pathway pseudopilin PulG